MAKRKREADTAKLHISKTVQSEQLDNKKRKSTSNGTPKAPVNGSRGSEPSSTKSSDGVGKFSPDIPSSQVSKPSNQNSTHVISSTIQVVTGSYERVLHGIQARIEIDTSTLSSTATFTDTFLFNAHTSAIRSLALSPAASDSSQNVYLATGSSDERINIYSLSSSPLPDADSKGRKIPLMPSLGPNTISETPMNRELGTLTQHSSTISALCFPTRGKLLSASEDNTISVTRVRDLTEIVTIRAPQPRLSGQASGDSASAGTTPAGVNDFAIHPSMKLMVSVGRGERCMRLWNLVTGKKAGVLNFNKDVLMAVKESKFSHGEGRKIQWNTAGTEFAVSFERGVVVLGQDSWVRGVALPQPLTKVHQIQYVSISKTLELLAVSTENGQIVFFDTSRTSPLEDTNSSMKTVVQAATAVAIVGGKEAGISGRIKDFVVLDLDAPFDDIAEKTSSDSRTRQFLVVAASSDGAVRLFSIKKSDLTVTSTKSSQPPLRVGTEIGKYETGNRITCMGAFVMLPSEDLEGGLSEFESSVSDSEGQSEDDSD